MALNTGKILMRRGQEVNFDPNKMTPGEWAVSLDSKFVRMCFSPGVCIRMATYEAFEADMVQIQRILEECQTIEEAVNRINDEISVKAQAVAEYTAQAKQYRDEAQQFRNEAFSSTPEGYLDLVEQVGENTRKIAEGVGGVSSYTDLENKPKINDVVLEGEKTLDELGIASKEALKETDNKVNIIIEQAELRFKETASGENIHLDDSADSKLVEFALYGKATQNGIPTPQNPVEIGVAGSDGSVEVKSVGKNLLPYPYYQTNLTEGEIEYVVNADGSVTANGTAKDISYFRLRSREDTENSLWLEAGSYILSGVPSSIATNEPYIWLGTTNDDGTATFLVGHYGSEVNGKTFTLAKKSKIHVQIVIAKGTTVNNLTFKPMIRLVTDTDNTWEPYKGKTATIPTPNGLAGIPVESGGNYTDQSGQQWICDEIVKYADGTGEYIKRVESVIFDGSEDEGWGVSSASDKYRINTDKIKDLARKAGNNNQIANILCSQFVKSSPNQTYLKNDGITVGDNGRLYIYSNEYSTNDVSLWKNHLFVNPIKCLFELATPITTPLTAEQIAEIEKLSTFYPITNISNDADCGMKVKYIADAKSYIDNRLALIEQAMLNSI